MYSLVRYFIKTSIVFLSIGLVSGGYMIVARDIGCTSALSDGNSARSYTACGIYNDDDHGRRAVVVPKTP